MKKTVFLGVLTITLFAATAVFADAFTSDVEDMLSFSLNWFFAVTGVCAMAAGAWGTFRSGAETVRVVAPPVPLVHQPGEAAGAGQDRQQGQLRQRHGG